MASAKGPSKWSAIWHKSLPNAIGGVVTALVLGVGAWTLGWVTHLAKAARPVWDWAAGVVPSAWANATEPVGVPRWMLWLLCMSFAVTIAVLFFRPRLRPPLLSSGAPRTSLSESVTVPEKVDGLGLGGIEHQMLRMLGAVDGRGLDLPTFQAQLRVTRLRLEQAADRLYDAGLVRTGRGLDRDLLYLTPEGRDLAIDRGYVPPYVP